MKYLTKILTAGLFTFGLFVACDKNDEPSGPVEDPKQDLSAYSHEVVTGWNQIALDAMGGPTYAFPLVNSRINAMMHIALHDAINSITPVYETYAYSGKYPDADPIAAAASAAHTVLRAHFPDQHAMLDTKLHDYLSKVKVGKAKTQGVELGKYAAAAILDLRENDGAFADPIGDNVPSSVPGVYQATEPFNFVYAEFWKDMQPFSMQNPEQFRSEAYPPLNSQDYADEYEEVKRIGEKDNAHRTDDEAFTGKFWYELSEMGWNKIARIVASKEQMDLPTAARMFALLDIAMADAYIAGWDSKYHYSFWRPITAIHAADDGNPATLSDPGWEPSEPTPPVADYPSTHSALGNAAATVLTHVLGNEVGFTMKSSTAVPNIARSFNSFHQAADENANSRVLAGIHFRSACEAGQKMGNEVADWTINSRLKPLK